MNKSKLTENQLFEVPKQRRYIQIFAEDFGMIVADSLDMKDLSAANRGYKHILSVMDVKSRYAWLFPLKTKKPSEIQPHIEKVIDEVRSRRANNNPLRPISFTTDNGKEFEIDRWLSQQGIHHQVVNKSKDPNDHRTGHIERFHRTILSRLRKLFASRGNNNWIDYIDKITDNYNNSIHRVIRTRPADVWNGKAQSKEVLRLQPNIPIGASVRVELPVYLFEKAGRAQRYSTEVYLIKDQQGYRYQVEGDGSFNGQWFLPRQLLIVRGVQDDGLLDEAVKSQNKERRELKSGNRQRRLMRKELAVGHEATLDEAGNPVLKKRLLPAEPKRRPKAKKEIE